MSEPLIIDAQGLYYRDLNQIIRDKVKEGVTHFRLLNVNGQRYIGAGITDDILIEVYGVAGQDLGIFMNGPTIEVFGNAQDCVGNTMQGRKIVVHGMAGDVCGYGMRGGKLHILRDVGYRVGIHMKTYREMVPVIIVGGRAGDFFGEYMAGGIMVLLNLWNDDSRSTVGDYLATGMHGGVIYIRGDVDPYIMGKEVGQVEVTHEDRTLLKGLLEEYCKDFSSYSLDLHGILQVPFTKLVPVSARPYGKVYAY